MTKIIILLSTIILTGCGFGAGTHGSIKGYQYSASKVLLEEAVNNVIKNDSTMHLDGMKGHYNDNVNYVTFTIKSDKGENEYVIRYLGDNTTWATSTTSEIFICYIYDEMGNGGSSGNDNWKKTPDDIKKKMIDLFETKFINKIDKALRVEHVDSY